LWYIWLYHTLCYFGTLSEHCSVVFNFVPTVKHYYKLQFSSCVISCRETVKRFPNPYRTEPTVFVLANNSNQTEPHFCRTRTEPNPSSEGSFPSLHYSSVSGSFNVKFRPRLCLLALNGNYIYVTIKP